MKIEEMNLKQLESEKKLFEKARLRAHRRQEFLGIMICDNRLERINKAIADFHKEG